MVLQLNSKINSFYLKNDPKDHLELSSSNIA